MSDQPKSILQQCAELTSCASHLAGAATMLSTTGGPGAVEEFEQVLQTALVHLGMLRTRLDDQIGETQRSQVAAVLRGDAAVRLNIGPGANPAAGWVNVDISHGDVIADIRRPLPFPDSCASHIYCSHVLEHLRNPDESHRFLRECRRVLRRGGKLRVVVPDIGEYLRAVIEHDDTFWDTHQKTWPWSRGDANRLDLTLRYAGAGPNPGDFFGHQHGYNAESLLATLHQAGFAPVKLSAFQRSDDDVFHIDDQSTVAHVQHDGHPLSLFAEGFSIF